MPASPNLKRRTTVLVAFLRAINVGKRRVAMKELAGLYEALGFGAVQTHLASGNVIFESTRAPSPEMEAELERAFAKRFGFAAETFLRTAGQVHAAIKDPPFDRIQDSDTIHVHFLREPLAKGTADALARVKTEHDLFAARGAEYYWLCRIRVSESKVFSSREIKNLILPVSTARSLVSLRKLVSLHLPRES